METMEINNRIYNSDLLKGTGLIQETMVLIDLFRAGMSKQDLINQVLEFNPLAKEHENRTKDIINHTFYRRFEGSIFNLSKLFCALNHKLKAAICNALGSISTP